MSTLDIGNTGVRAPGRLNRLKSKPNDFRPCCVDPGRLRCADGGARPALWSPETEGLVPLRPAENPVSRSPNLLPRIQWWLEHESCQRQAPIGSKAMSEANLLYDSRVHVLAACQVRLGPARPGGLSVTHLLPLHAATQLQSIAAQRVSAEKQVDPDRVTPRHR